MTQQKTISVSLDEDLVAALEDGQGDISSQVNKAVRASMARSISRQFLELWLGRLDDSDGVVDELRIAHFEALGHTIVLDAAAIDALSGGPSSVKQVVRAAMTAAVRLEVDVVVPAALLAAMYEGANHNAVVEACLSNEIGFHIRETDRALVRLVGGVLTVASAGPERIVDAHIVAAAAEGEGGVILTDNPDSLSLLAIPYPDVTIVDITA